MALQAVCEVALHFGSFKNIDLFFQGVYQLKCRVFEESEGGSTVEAVPYAFNPEVAAKRTAEAVKPAAVLASEAAFCTKSILIRYVEEIQDVNDVVLFRLERAWGKDTPLTVEVELHFAEAIQQRAAAAFQASTFAAAAATTPPHGTRSPKSPHSSPSSRSPARVPVVPAISPPGDEDFVRVASQRLRLNNVMQGIHACCPISFDEGHFCRLEIMAHSTLLDFRLRIRPEAPLPSFTALQRRARSGPGGLVDELVDLAGQLAAVGAEALGSPPASAAASRLAAGGPTADAAAEPEAELEASPSSGPAAAVGGESLSLGEAVDYIQRQCLARLRASHEDLATFLSDLCGEDLPGEALQPFRLPGQTTTEAGKGSDSLTPISERLGDTREPTVAAMAVRLLVEDLNFVSAQVLQAWQLVLRSCMQRPQVAAGLLLDAWDEQLARHWAGSVHCRTVPASDLAAHLEEDMASSNSRAAAARRLSLELLGQQHHDIEDLTAVPPPSEQPLIFEQRYGPEEQCSPGGFGATEVKRPEHCSDGSASYGGLHVFVLVHGFQGTNFDMRLMKNNIALLYPAAMCLCSLANEEDTEGNIEVMGEKLAAEVRTFVQEWCVGDSKEPSFARLSFITHSVGGLIARAALPLLTEFHDRMHTFLSFSSPHLGYLYSPTSLFRAGLWVAKKIKKSKCLDQLSMTDAPDPGSGFLSRLSELPGLEHFQHVVLISSHQDQYAPFESARIEMPREAEADPKLGPCYAKMLHNLLDPLKAERVIRMDVNFHIPETNIDTVIGRTAHIQFIESQPLMKMLLQTHGFLFE